jgi:hypothetical protein
MELVTTHTGVTGHLLSSVEMPVSSTGMMRRGRLTVEGYSAASILGARRFRISFR